MKELVAVVYHAGKDNVGTLDVDAPADTVVEGLGLLVDFLEHEVRIAPLFELAEVHGKTLDLRGNLHIVEVHDFQGSVPADDGNFPVIEVNHLVGVFHDGGSV